MCKLNIAVFWLVICNINLFFLQLSPFVYRSGKAEVVQISLPRPFVWHSEKFFLYTSILIDQSEFNMYSQSVSIHVNISKIENQNNASKMSIVFH